MNSLTLPIILSGPIVRRAEPTQITIWIATSKRYRIHAKVFRITSNKDTELFEYHGCAPCLGALFFNNIPFFRNKKDLSLFIHFIFIVSYLK